MIKNSKKEKNKNFKLLTLIIVLVLIVIILVSVPVKNVLVIHIAKEKDYKSGGTSSLIEGYIKNGVTIGGITGTLQVTDFSQANVAGQYIVSGKSAYGSDGKKKDGTYEFQSGQVKGNSDNSGLISFTCSFKPSHVLIIANSESIYYTNLVAYYCDNDKCIILENGYSYISTGVSDNTKSLGFSYSGNTVTINLNPVYSWSTTRNYRWFAFK